MTRDEILAQAKVGGRALLAVDITAVFDDAVEVNVGGQKVCPGFYSFIEIKQPLPPETPEQENARLKARIDHLEDIVQELEKLNASLAYSQTRDNITP